MEQNTLVLIKYGKKEKLAQKGDISVLKNKNPLKVTLR